MKRVTVRVGFVAVAAAGIALVVGAQGPPGGFGGPGPGMFEFGGLIGGFGGKTVKGKPFQASFTITTVQTLPGNSITNTKNGTVARDTDGSTYRDVTFSAIGPWASGKTHEVAYIRNLSTSMEYIIDVMNGTYEAFPLREHNPTHEGKNSRPGSASSNETVSDNPNATYTDTATNAQYKVDDRLVTRTIPAGQIGNSAAIVITTERWYSSDLDVLLKETRSDPRFGTTTYQLTNIGQPQSSMFLPNPSFTQVQGRGFGPHGGHGQPPPPPPPQD